MMAGVAGEIDLDGPLPDRRFFVQAKLEGDDELDHPYGQWSLAVEPVVLGGEARFVFMAFVSLDAPHDRLKRGARLELFRGPKWVGTAFVR